MKKSDKKKPNKIIVLSAMIIVVTLVIGAVFIYMPFSKRTTALRSEILRERDRNLLIGKIRALGRHLKVYKKMTPEGRDISWLLSTVSDMATDEQIEISSIKPLAPEEQGLYTKLCVTMDIVSTYNQLGRFVSRIESYKKFLRIEGINIKRLDSDKEIDEGATKFKSFDIKSHIVVSTVVLKE